MKKIFLLTLILGMFCGCGISEGGSELRIRIESGDSTIIYRLNDSSAARDLWNQLPIETEIENYGSNEKIFHPNRKLDTRNTNLAEPRIETLGYFEPWNNVVLYYGNFEKYPGLYSLGEIVSGFESIPKLHGKIKISREDSK